MVRHLIGLMFVPVSHRVLCWAPYCLSYDLHHSVTNSTLKIFADDVKVVTDASDCDLLQEDLSRISEWTVAWQVRLNPGKCEAL